MNSVLSRAGQSCCPATIRFGILPLERSAAAALYWQAFGTKLGRVMGPDRRALSFIERVMDAGHVLAAGDAEGRIVGVIGFRSSRGAFVAGTLDDMRAVYGRFGAVWRARALAVLAQELPEGEIAVDGLVVAVDRQGEGIGTALVSALAAEARGRGYRAIRLDVVEGNVRARALYERLGFRAEGRVGGYLVGLIFGFRNATVMVLDL